jgi:hypothetical protein
MGDRVRGPARAARPSPIVAGMLSVRKMEGTMNAAETAPDFDRKFRAIYDRDVEWQESAAIDLLTLPKGLKVKIFAHDPVMKRIDMKVQFPPGYIEPAHSHKSWHSIVVLKGRMCVAGKDLRPGDYVFGWDELHGPYEYPDGCEVFIVFMGEGTQHVWDAARHDAHKKVWTPETAAGRDAAE